MLRFYKQFMGQVLQVLVLCREAMYDINPCDIADDARRVDGVSSEVAEALTNIYNRIGYGKDSYDRLLEVIAAQINNDKDTSKDLVDLIVKILQLPYGSNVLSGRTLEALRNAILVPSEVAAFRARVEEVELSCTSCGHQFIQGEMATFARNDGAWRFVCTTCYMPTSMACGSNCKSCTRVELPKKVMRVLEEVGVRSKCRHTKASVQAPEAREPVVTVASTSGITFTTPAGEPEEFIYVPMPPARGSWQPPATYRVEINNEPPTTPPPTPTGRLQGMTEGASIRGSSLGFNQDLLRRWTRDITNRQVLAEAGVNVSWDSETISQAEIVRTNREE